MKRLIRWALNHLPRTFLQRIAGISVPVLGWFYIGRGVECPVCGTRRRKFLPYGYVHSRPNALCPRCLSLERHRLLWLYLQRETDLPTAYPRILHIAPEVCLMRNCANITTVTRACTSPPTSKVRWPTYISTCSTFPSRTILRTW